MASVRLAYYLFSLFRLLAFGSSARSLILRRMDPACCLRRAGLIQSVLSCDEMLSSSIVDTCIHQGVCSIDIHAIGGQTSRHPHEVSHRLHLTYVSQGVRPEETKFIMRGQSSSTRRTSGINSQSSLVCGMISLTREPYICSTAKVSTTTLKILQSEL